ncbi:hypothetical protein AAMO2058_000070500 [Amorphochlora amoebiformis]
MICGFRMSFGDSMEYRRVENEREEAPRRMWGLVTVVMGLGLILSGSMKTTGANRLQGRKKSVLPSANTSPSNWQWKRKGDEVACYQIAGLKKGLRTGRWFDLEACTYCAGNDTYSVKISTDASTNRSRINGLELHSVKPEYIRTPAEKLTNMPSGFPTYNPVVYQGLEKEPYRPKPLDLIELGRVDHTAKSFQKPLVNWEWYKKLPGNENKTLKDWKIYNDKIALRKIPDPARVLSNSSEPSFPSGPRNPSEPSLAIPADPNEIDSKRLFPTSYPTRFPKRTSARFLCGCVACVERGTKSLSRRTYLDHRKRAILYGHKVTWEENGLPLMCWPCGPNEEPKYFRAPTAPLKFSEYKLPHPPMPQSPPPTPLPTYSPLPPALLAEAPHQLSLTAPPTVSEASPSVQTRQVTPPLAVQQTPPPTYSGEERERKTKHRWVQEWLSSFTPSMIEYADAFISNYIEGPGDLSGITEEDLETEFKITKKFHRRKLIKEIQKLSIQGNSGR